MEAFVRLSGCALIGWCTASWPMPAWRQIAWCVCLVVAWSLLVQLLFKAVA